MVIPSFCIDGRLFLFFLQFPLLIKKGIVSLMAEILIVKAASENTLADIHALASELLHNPSSYLLLSQTALEELLKNPNAVFIGAFEEHKMIGMGLLHITQKIEGLEGHIEDVVVAKVGRGKGIGEEISKKLIHEAKKRGVNWIYLSSKADRVAASALYQKLGFQKRETNAYKLEL